MTVPLPLPGSLGLVQYAGVDMLAYADVCVVAETADMRRELTQALQASRYESDLCEQALQEMGALQKRVKVLEDVLREYIDAADACVSGDDDVVAMLRFGEADKAAREALKGANHE